MTGSRTYAEYLLISYAEAYMVHYSTLDSNTNFKSENGDFWQLQISDRLDQKSH
ncbi:MAG: hypothetical protein IM585_11165 [Pseudanabaena sp. M135S2SP2A07QC]|uniref:hypothetical protein n=1 Tax=Pseudanabaena mucicola TaxID=71190 RepID=UPI00257918A2|nr:hypothetical protein [Pseudanabaena mucicola]MCA6552539.1 hypothetical protein [Pseudanabaena sp. M135S2SP2A07QC]MCA6586062.1 hypothetical protein [Pseudanabaena sp. M051S1SP1A06QC]MCA6596516.1 hypothetical protein [Pseudanabaena sp. M046S1SP1A06QC]